MMPTDDTSASPDSSIIGSEEELLRRVPPHWYPDPNHLNRPQWQAFKPTTADQDGLSVGRRRLVVSVEDFSYTPARDRRRSVAQIVVSQVRSLRLAVESKPLPGDGAHAVIPEMNFRDYDADRAKKTRIKEWALRLAYEFAEMVLILESDGPGLQQA